ncbi:MAG: DUF4159 domain-containing protein [Verrucomicrobiales bacterium]|nr:DUF4159 domain-containing protein [Verrucomicrobiales bacterium]
MRASPPVFPRERRSSKLALVLLTLALAGAGLLAQRRWRNYEGEEIRTARELAQNDFPTPEWKNDPEFEKDVFTFARIRYTSESGRGRWSRGGWATDIPDSDLNLSYRLQQMTALKVDPNGRVINLTDKELFNYPWIYIVEPGALAFEEEEVPILRRYLLNGGFLMVDDFWGEDNWDNFAQQMSRVFPEREFVELPLTHPLYHCVFTIDAKYQIPFVRLGMNSQYTGVTWEQSDAREVHHRVLFDDKQRIMVIACHNTDNGDGWEWEGANEYYFRQFSERAAYPLGINIIFYAMTH